MNNNTWANNLNARTLSINLLDNLKKYVFSTAMPESLVLEFNFEDAACKHIALLIAPKIDRAIWRVLSINTYEWQEELELDLTREESWQWISNQLKSHGCK